MLLSNVKVITLSYSCQALGHVPARGPPPDLDQPASWGRVFPQGITGTIRYSVQHHYTSGPGRDLLALFSVLIALHSRVSNNGRGRITY